MTTEEAIKDLKQWAEACRFASDTDRDGYWATAYRKDAEALEMAILALETRQELAEAWAEDHCAECRFRRGQSDD